MEHRAYGKQTLSSSHTAQADLELLVFMLSVPALRLQQTCLAPGL